jgi:hypothetical protein
MLMITKLFKSLTSKASEFQEQSLLERTTIAWQKQQLAQIQRARLDNVLTIAEEIAKKNPEALKDFVRLLGRPIQSHYMCRAVTQYDSKPTFLFAEYVWFPKSSLLNKSGHSLETLKQKIELTRTLRLASDLVLPWPWKQERFVTNFTDLGANREEWKQDFRNHLVEYWLPFGIGWVYSGNHSIMLGIVQGQGNITTDSVYDMSALFPLVRFDGTAFIGTDNGEVLSEGENFEFACIFEVGRIMQKYGVSA